MTIRAAAVVALLTPALVLGGALAGCSPSGSSVTSVAKGDEGKYKGLDDEILKWRKEIIATDPLCQSKATDQKCESFEVACKAERTVTPQEQAQGVVGHVVAMVAYNGFDPKFQHAQSGTQIAEFTKTANGWTRTKHGPVYMQNCGDM
ncbi:MAG: hypothetical protein ACXU8S_17520 [Phenylobacterium sp.]